MIHKIAIVGALLSILYVVYTSMYKGYILTPVLLIMAVLAAVYYITTSVVTKGMVRKKEGKDILSYRGGLVDKSDLIPGRLAFDGEKIVFYKRKGDLGGLEESMHIATGDLQSYNIGKINEYHSGIKLKTTDGSEYSIKCKEILGNESAFLSAIGWEMAEGGDGEDAEKTEN